MQPRRRRERKEQQSLNSFRPLSLSFRSNKPSALMEIMFSLVSSSLAALFDCWQSLRQTSMTRMIFNLFNDSFWSFLGQKRAQQMLKPAKKRPRESFSSFTSILYLYFPSRFEHVTTASLNRAVSVIEPEAAQSNASSLAFRQIRFPQKRPSFGLRVQLYLVKRNLLSLCWSCHAGSGDPCESCKGRLH